MFEQNNPLAFKDIESSLDVDNFYGEDPTRPRRKGSNNLLTDKVSLPNMTELTMLVNDNFDLNRVSTEGRVDIYMDILEFIGQNIEQ